MMVINKENIEECLLLLTDGELSAADEMTVMTFVEKHPEYQGLLDEFLQTKLDMEDIVFEDKGSLLKPERKALTLFKRKPVLYRAAAIFAVIVIGAAFRIVIEDRSVEKPIIVLQPVIEKSDNRIAEANKIEEKKANPPNSNSKNYQVRQKSPAVVAVAYKDDNERADRTEVLNPMPVKDYSEIEIDDSRFDIVSVATIPAPADLQQMQTSVDDESLVQSDKREVLNALIAQFETLKDNLHEKAKSLKITTVAFRLGDKEFTIGK